MAELATDLIRTTVRAFHSPEHAIIVDCLIVHSVLTDRDLEFLTQANGKGVRKWCQPLKEAGLVSSQIRQERRADGTGGYHGGVPAPGKERYSQREWYYLNYHRAIDSIKYRMYKLTKHIESLGMPTTERKELSCPRCKSQYTELEGMDSMDDMGNFICKKCKHVLDHVEEDELANENESMKRLNQQTEKLTNLLKQIDATTVPENDFHTALQAHKPVERPDNHPGAKMEVVDDRNKNLQSSKGLEIKPEKIAVQVQDDEDVKRENAAAEAQAKKEREAKQNALPEWITHSTVQNGAITAVGAKEEHQRQQREAHSSGAVKDEEGEDVKPAAGDDDAMAQYWKQLEAEKAQEAQKAREEEDEDEEEDEEDEFEDIDITGGGGTPANGMNGTAANSTGMNTPANVESSNATDDERETKRIKLEAPSSSTAPNGTNGNAETAEDTPAASDADDDELDFEDVK
ncbi:Transcription initiation factor IIE subunit alpha [Lecanosticta acicola]|uniref:Transcription initiation factor IIE subunit alpha n=1 Tax=Lecanosticta acicola TaxID=111012 RepID=A0AAI8Z5P2_9PEZI|nr:Transcription initiation factor IIE subunit alpha [Lecanosticta acicola]